MFFNVDRFLYKKNAFYEHHKPHFGSEKRMKMAIKGHK